MKIRSIRITPAAACHLRLTQLQGAYTDAVLRSIIEAKTVSGLAGLTEASGDAETLGNLRVAAEALRGLDIFAVHELHARIAEALSRKRQDGATACIAPQVQVEPALGAFETACLDLPRKLLNLPVSDLLGGALRSHVQVGVRVVYKFRGKETLSGDDLSIGAKNSVALARRMVGEQGLRGIPRLGAAPNFTRDVEIIQNLRQALPDVALRLDPQVGWSVDTEIRNARRLMGLLAHLEDSRTGLYGLAAVARFSPLPLATSRAVTSHEPVIEALRKGAVRTVVADPGHWGPRGCLQHGRMCQAGRLGNSLHSAGQLGIGLAATAHLVAAMPGPSRGLRQRSPHARRRGDQGWQAALRGGPPYGAARPGSGRLDRRAGARPDARALPRRLRARIYSAAPPSDHTPEFDCRAP